MRLESLPGGRWALYSPYSQALVDACHQIPGLVWDKVLRAWVGYIDAWAECDNLAVKELVDQARVQAIVLYNKGSFDTRLRRYQLDGYLFLLGQSHEGALLADGMGFGKTAQAISAVWSGADAPVIVCPSFVKGVWLREIAKWAPGGEATIKGVFQPEGLKPTAIPETYHTILVHYDILYAWVDAIKTWLSRDSVPNKWLVLDECHFISSEKARRSAACRELARVATHRVGLSGTPLTSRVRDLWNVVDTLSPGRFGNFFQYAKKYCGAQQVVVGSGPMQKTVWDFDGRSNLEELSRRMKHFMLRRTHADVNLELPALTRQVVELRVTKKHRKAVTAGADKHALRASLDHAADAKLHDVVAMCKQHLEDGHSVVVGCYRRSVAEAVAKECNGVYIHGGLTHKQREEVIEGCRKCSEPCLLAATIDVAAVGIDLTFADVVVFCELTWEPHELAQFEARVFRFGQTKTTLVQYCIALSTSDELIRDGVIDKLEEVSTKVLGSDGTSLGADLRGGKTAEEELAEFWKGLVK